MNDYIYSLIAKVLNEEATKEEIAALDEHIKLHPESAAQFEMLQKIWPMQAEIKSTTASNIKRTDEVEKLNSIINRAVRQRQAGEGFEVDEINSGANSVVPIKRSFRNYFKYVAAAVTIAACSVFFYKYNQPLLVKDYANIELATENGSRKRILLPDGTSVLLNSGSKLIYNADFDGKTREVTLFGEAFFDVVKNPQCPFIVHAGSINIKVLGTAFNVKSYPGDDATETTLIHGLVEIKKQGQQDVKPIYLHPNEKISLPSCIDCDAISNKISNSKTEDENRAGKIVVLDSLAKDKEWVETAWIYNRLEFRKTSFTEIAKKLERWYGVNITINNDKLAAQNFNGSFENETLEQALKALQKTTAFTFKINNNEVFINASE